MNSDVGILRSLSRSEFSGVSLLPDQETTLSLDRRFVNSIKDGITEALSSKLMKFDPRYFFLFPPLFILIHTILPSVGGVLLNRENITDRSLRVLSNCSELIPSFQVSLQVHSSLERKKKRENNYCSATSMSSLRGGATSWTWLWWLSGGRMPLL